MPRAPRLDPPSDLEPPPPVPPPDTEYVQSYNATQAAKVPRLELGPPDDLEPPPPVPPPVTVYTQSSKRASISSLSTIQILESYSAKRTNSRDWRRSTSFEELYPSPRQAHRSPSGHESAPPLPAREDPTSMHRRVASSVDVTVAQSHGSIRSSHSVSFTDAPVLDDSAPPLPSREEPISLHQRSHSAVDPYASYAFAQSGSSTPTRQTVSFMDAPSLTDGPAPPLPAREEPTSLHRRSHSAVDAAAGHMFTQSASMILPHSSAPPLPCREDGRLIQRSNTAIDLPSAHSFSHSSSAVLTRSQTSTSVSLPLTEEEKEEKRIRMRKNTLKELMDTETIYFTHLKTLMYNFVQPLKEVDLKGADKEALLVPLLSSLAPLIQLTKEIMKGIQAQFMASSEVENLEDVDQLEATQIGQVFAQWAPTFKMYQSYINGYERMVGTFHKLSKESKIFREFCKKVAEEANQQDISFFLILPVQRLPRYEMLLKEIMKYTLETDPDHQYLKVAVEKIKEVNDLINAKKKQDEMKEKSMQIQQSINFSHSNEQIAILQPGRRFVKEGDLESLHKKKRRVCHCFLFTDILIKTKLSYVNKKTEKAHYNFILALRLSDVEIRDTDEASGFTLTKKNNPEEEETFVCSSVKEKKEWVLTITGLLAKLHN